MRAIFTLALTLVLAGVLVAQQPTTPRAPAPRPAAPRAAPRTDAVVPFAVGETLTFDVSWSQYLTAGSAVLRVVEKRPSLNSSAYSLVADGRPIPLVARFYPVYYKMDSLLDSVTSLSQSTSLYMEENGQKRQTTMRFDRVRRRAYYEVTSAPTAKADFAVPDGVQDGLAMLYAIRGRAFRAGERFTVPVADDGSLYSVAFDVTGPESVVVPAGTVSAWNLKVSTLDAERQPVGNNISVWISSDARRLPVKIQADLPVGSFTLALREAR